eukprot:COSAG06_NODE_677_length_13149_cov_37.657854_7_plen_194_part_00
MDGHSDAIMDCAYNFHGTRLATCAADRRIIVWDQSADGQWTHSSAPLERHSSAVYKVDWAHPEFGQVIASCSADRTVVVWEETQNRYRSTVPARAVSICRRPAPPACALTAGRGARCRSRKRQWVNRATLSDSRCPVVDVQFAPRHQGLKLAAARCTSTLALCRRFRTSNTRAACMAWPAVRMGACVCTRRSM